MAALFLNRESSPTAVEVESSNMHSAQKPLDYFAAERMLGLLLIALLAFWLRARDPGFTTAYMDESIYVVYGRMFLARHFEAPLDSPLRWSFGWYLWPALAALADRVGGLIAVRELAAALGTGAVVAVYKFSRRLFDANVGLGSAALFAVIAPAVMASRIATRDAGAIFFFSFALWAFVAAWQTNQRRCWLAAALCLLSAFLCKYVICIFLPFLCLLALRKGWHALLAFCLPLAAALGAYFLFYRSDLTYLLMYGRSYGSLRASAADVFDVYVRGRVELWLIAALALMAFVPRAGRKTTAVLWLGAAVAFAFQWKTRADYDFWKHAAYPLIFLTPLAVRTILAAAKRLSRGPEMQIALSVAGVLSVCAIAGWTGKSLAYDKTVFWPNVDPVLSYFEGRLAENDRILSDDTVFRYYFHPQLSQSQMVDPFYLSYKQMQGEPAYRAAVEDGVFDYIVLDGGAGAEAQALQKSIQGHLQLYALCMQMPDPTLGHTIQIFQRGECSSQPAQDGIAIDITSPTANAFVDKVSSINGIVRGAGAGWYVRPEVFSNRWYPLPELPLQADGSFQASAIFGGEGEQACHQMLRVRLYDKHGQPRAVSVLFNLKTKGSCREQ